MSRTVHGRRGLSPSLAVLTGGTGGIGQEIATLLLEQGWRVLLLTRNPDAVSRQFPKAGDRIRGEFCDLTQPASLANISAAILKAGEQIGLLIHCAGRIDPQAGVDITEMALHEQISINLTTPILLTRQLLSGMARPAHIIFLNSIAGVMPLEGSSVYSATKFGLRGFARSLAPEIRHRDVRVSSIFLGAVDTPMLRKETKDGGSILNFVSQPLCPRSVAALIVRTVYGPGREVFMPWIDGIFAHLCLTAPWLLRLSTPILEAFARRGLARYLSRPSASTK